MDWRVLTGLLSAAVTWAGLVPYIRATARGEIRPSAVTWSGIALLNGIAFAAQMTAEPSWSAVAAGNGAIGGAIIVVLALREGSVQLAALDIACAVLGVLAIVAWQVTQDPQIALAIAIAASLIMSIPMLVKTIRDPGSEPAGVFVIWLGSSALAMISAVRLDFLSIGWPSFFAVFDCTMALLALRGRGVRVQQQADPTHQIAQGSNDMAPTVNVL